LAFVTGLWHDDPVDEAEEAHQQEHAVKSPARRPVCGCPPGGTASADAVHEEDPGSTIGTSIVVAVPRRWIQSRPMSKSTIVTGMGRR